jgi:hypothetical protein
MKNSIAISVVSIFFLFSCQEDDINLFDKTADERVAEAIAALKEDLVEPGNGWKVQYRPELTSGSFYVLLDFNADNTVTIKTDLGVNEGEFFEQTITYRIDNSLGLELVFESYSFFSYLFELDQATFGAEYEFNFVTKNSDDNLVFSSKTDLSTPTTLLFEKASANDISLLGKTLAGNLNLMSNDIDRFSSSLKLTYTNKDLILYLSLNESTRTLSLNSASKKTDTQVTQALDFDTPYVIKGDSIVFDTRFSRSLFGSSTAIKSIKFAALSDASINICAEPIPIHVYDGVTSANDPVLLETAIAEANGKRFAARSDFFFCPLNFVFDNGQSVGSEIETAIPDAVEIHLYYNVRLNDGTDLYGIGFVLRNSDGSTTFALREFVPILNDNNLVFNFKPGFRFFGNPNPDAANLAPINTYLEKLSEGDKTYVFEFDNDIYEFYNPCNGWSFVFVNGNR